jgi:hypothetical protein
MKEKVANVEQNIQAGKQTDSILEVRIEGLRSRLNVWDNRLKNDAESTFSTVQTFIKETNKNFNSFSIQLEELLKTQTRTSIILDKQNNSIVDL